MKQVVMITCAATAGELHMIELDVLSEQSAADAVARVVDKQGRIDVVVHNAAHLFVGLTEAFTPEQAIDAYDTNTVGPLRINRAVLPAMRRQNAAAKAAFDAFAESIAWDVASLGIETTIVQPGVFTQGTEHFAAAASADDADRAAEYDGTAASRSFASMSEDTERLFAPGTTGDRPRSSASGSLAACT